MGHILYGYILNIDISVKKMYILNVPFILPSLVNTKHISQKSEEMVKLRSFRTEK